MNGGPLDPSLAATIARAACAVSNAALEDTNYTTAGTNARYGIPFDGVPADDLMRPDRRRAIMSERIRDLRAAARAVDALRLDGRVGAALAAQLAAAARADLADATGLMAFDRRWPPGDRDAPQPPVSPPTRLVQAALAQRPPVRRALDACRVPPDLRRRAAAYDS